MSSLSFDLQARYPDQIDALFDSFGYTRLLDQMAFVPIVIICSIGFVTNLFSFLVCLQLAKEFNSIGLYKYMQIYCLTSAAVCFIQIFTFVLFSQRSFPWTVTKPAFDFIIWIYLPVYYTGYFYGSVLDIFITLDRISSVKTSFNWVKTSKIFSLCAIAFIAIVIFETPCFFNFQSNSISIPLMSKQANGTSFANQSVIWWYPSITPFAASKAGSAIIIIIEIVRDVVIGLLDLVVNLISLFYLKVYIRLRHRVLAGQSISLTNSTDGEETNTRSARAQLNLTKLVFVICLLSIFEHVTMTVNILYPYHPSYTTASFVLISMFGFLSVALKHCSNFFVFYVFNATFRRITQQKCKELLRLFKRL